MVIGVFVATVVVVTVKPTAVVPEATVTLTGTLATAGLLLDNDTTAPAGGAPPDNNTNPDVLEPPATLAGLTVTLCKVGPAASGVTVSVALLVSPLYEAVMVTGVVVVTAEVFTMKLPVNPVAVVVAGTLATAGLLLDKEITTTFGSHVDMTRVPKDALPPTTLAGLRSIVDNWEGGRAAWGVKLRTADHGPKTPAEFTPRTRQKWVLVPSPDVA